MPPAVGPVLAGWLVQYATWRWIFLLNVPVVIAGLRSLPAVERHTSRCSIFPASFSARLPSLSYGLSQGGTSWTSAQTLGGLAVGAVALLAFTAVELHRSNPLPGLHLFGSIDFSLAIVVQWVGQFALFGSLFLVPLFLQQARGYGAFDTGFIVLPQAIAAGIFMPVGGILFDKIGARPLVMLGLGIVAVSTFLLSRVGITTTGRDLIVPLGLSGAGMGLMMMPLNTHLLNTTPRRLVSRVTSLTGALQQVVNSFSIAGLSTILTARLTARIGAAQATLAAHHIHAPITQAPGHTPPNPQVMAVLGRAAALAFDDTFHVMVIAAVAGALMGLLRRVRAERMGPADAAMPATGDIAAGTFLHVGEGRR